MYHEVFNNIKDLQTTFSDTEMPQMFVFLPYSA